ETAVGRSLPPGGRLGALNLRQRVSIHPRGGFLARGRRLGIRFLFVVVVVAVSVVVIAVVVVIVVGVLVAVAIAAVPIPVTELAGTIDDDAEDVGPKSVEDLLGPLGIRPAVLGDPDGHEYAV